MFEKALQALAMKQPAVASGALPQALQVLYAGPNAQTADKEALSRAIVGLAQGLDPETIRAQTGWFQGPDQKWRFEIDDSKAQLGTERANKLGSALLHPELFKAYPELSEVPFSYRMLEPSLGGSFSQSEGIQLNQDLKRSEEAENIALHELQHFIQEKEGFAPGGSLAAETLPRSESGLTHVELLRKSLDIMKRYSTATPEERASLDVMNEEMKRLNATPLLSQEEALANYKRLGGEAEARDVEARRHLTPAQRRATPPYSSIQKILPQLILR